MEKRRGRKETEDARRIKGGNEKERDRSSDQNTDTSFPNQETLTSHPYKPTHGEETPQ